ncbi:MAG: glycosyltransferase [Ruminococcaceae bacterium]|nr:glycosyltransferase [Oscillospiraceae bacterium]
MEKFSVSMCVYGGDHPAWFQTSVDSIRNQTAPPDEIVLVVDGPVPEDLNAVICQYEKEPIFHVIRLEKNMGHGEARRISLNACKHSLVALMDADDISVPDRFAKQIKMFAEDPALTIVGGNITEFVDTPDNLVGMRTVYTTDSEIKQDMKKRCPMNQMTVMFRKADVEAAGGYVDWYCDEDYYLWLRLMLSGAKFCNIPETLVNVRVGKEMYSRRGGMKYFKSEAKLQKWMLKKKVIGFGTYAVNVAKRLIVQVLLPNSLRSWVFQKFARKSV